jgi:hypothetical protein
VRDDPEADLLAGIEDDEPGGSVRDKFLWMYPRVRKMWAMHRQAEERKKYQDEQWARRQRIITAAGGILGVLSVGYSLYIALAQ